MFSQLRAVIQTKCTSNVNTNELKHSGTGYFYPIKVDNKNIETITSVENGHFGFIIPMDIKYDDNEEENTKSFGMFHLRYYDSPNGTVCFCGPKEIHYDCVVNSYDIENVMKKITTLFETGEYKFTTLRKSWKDENEEGNKITGTIYLQQESETNA